MPAMAIPCGGSIMPNILDLPDELILLVISDLLAIRLEQPQSKAFRNRHRETDRQYENSYRRTALHALCLTSTRLYRLAVPALYNTVTGSTTSYGITPLRLVCRTLRHNEKLRLHVQYVENLLEDCLGNKLARDLDELRPCAAEELVRDYFENLAWIIRMCPNIQQMSLISVESPVFTLWGNILDLPEHSLLKLEKVAFQTNTREDYDRGETRPFNQILFGLLQCSSLRELRASGVVGEYSYEKPLGMKFQHLQRLEITECTLPHENVDDALSVCESLRHLVCHWTFLWCQLSHQQIDFLPNLLQQQKSLETLCLTAKRAGFDSTSQTFITCSSLHRMTALKKAKLCNIFIPDKQCRLIALPAGAPEVPIAPELAPFLEHLTISYTMHYINPDEWRNSVFISLRSLADDCAHYLPHLRELVIQFEEGRVGSHDGDDQELVRKFDERGIRLSIVEELVNFTSRD